MVTIDTGANDVQRCVSRSPLGIDLTCIQQGLGDVQRLLPQVLSQLHRAAPGARVVVLNHYNPFLAAYLTGPTGQVLVPALGGPSRPTGPPSAPGPGCAGSATSTPTTPGMPS